MEDDLQCGSLRCRPKAGADRSVVERPEECGRRFRNTQEQRDMKCQQVIERNFRMGRQPGVSTRVSRGEVSGLA